MIISNCPKHTIEAAASEVGLRADINTLSPSGLRHRVKLYPSIHKTIKVEAGSRIFYSHTKALRKTLMDAYNELPLNSELRGDLGLFLRTHDHEDFPKLPDAIHATALKLAKLILGRERTHYKRIAPFQRMSPSGSRAICAVCWHGFRDFFKQLFAFKPDANAYTAFAKYKGLDGFLANYPATAHKNIGSAYNPMSASEACWCDA